MMHLLLRTLQALLHLARPSDAAAWSTFIRGAFLDAFGPQNTEEDMTEYLAGAFSEAIQSAELADPNCTLFLAEQDGRIVGCAMTSANSNPPPCVSDPSAFEISRVYGIGFGKLLMDRCLSHALWNGSRVTWLGVWERNHRAIRFYERYGFKRVGEYVFKLGSDPQTDEVMERIVDPIAATPATQPTISSTATDKAMTAYVPLLESESIEQRVLHAFTHGTRIELEREHGCSVLQVACMLRMTEDAVTQTANTNVADGKLAATKDASHFQAR